MLFLSIPDVFQHLVERLHSLWRPYPVPDSDATLYDVVSHEGFHDVDPHPDWDWGAPKHRWRLYSQMLFQAESRSACCFFSEVDTVMSWRKDRH